MTEFEEMGVGRAPSGRADRDISAQWKRAVGGGVFARLVRGDVYTSGAVLTPINSWQYFADWYPVGEWIQEARQLLHEEFPTLYSNFRQ